jgi:hypothetical protein
VTNRDIADLIYDRVCGTPQDIMTAIDQMIEDHEIGIDHFRQNEMEILNLVDDRMFNCEVCGWNVDACEVSLEASNMGSLICCDCGGEDES